ncbi:PKD-like family lipoprotein [Longitalea arenae]|uniref:PKD-like family lipoprotein n=1 Tax=Longitalea arenae TaxID=2812558 RepID=UPI00196883C5|nr:PKD-like family lipoprotein [Longitalea arenae]
MKRSILAMLTAFALLQLACYKDKGNYDYHPLAKPEISNLDTFYNVFLGDTLVIQPTIKSTDPSAKFGYHWRIDIPAEARSIDLTGSPLNFIFSLQPGVYGVRLTVTDSSNGMKYFQQFKIAGRTQFSVGTLVLSQEGNTSQLSFVKPDSTVLSRIYQALHGSDLPGEPLQVIDLIKQFISPVPQLGYWVTFNGSNDGGVHLNTSTLLEMKTLRKNFFDVPAIAKPGYLETSQDGVLRGVINGKLYIGSWQTYYGSDIYGYFGVPAAGDYELYKRMAFNGVMPYFLGYDKNRKQFVAFTNFGSPAYIGTGYQVTNVTAFDPRNVQLDLLHFQQLNDNNCFAFGRSGDGALYEIQFSAAFKGFIELSPGYKRAFAQPALITPNTKWTGTKKEIFYFTSGDKIYRYNPLNQEFRPLTTDFGGKEVSMIKLADDENTLIAGVEGTIYFLDISTGKTGEILKRYTGIPGTPVDVTVKK